MYLVESGIHERMRSIFELCKDEKEEERGRCADWGWEGDFCLDRVKDGWRRSGAASRN